MVETRSARPGGFTLMEVLVAVIIAAMCVTIFFQLFSSGMKLEVRARELMDEAFQTRRLFSELMQRDIQADDFPWSGEDGDVRWQVRMDAVEVREVEATDGPVLSLPLELYRVELLLALRPGLESRFVRYVTFAPGELSEEFKGRFLGGLGDEVGP